MVSSDRPCRATNTRPGSLIQISSTARSSKNRCSGPKPATWSNTLRAVASASPSGGSADTAARSG